MSKPENDIKYYMKKALFFIFLFTGIILTTLNVAGVFMSLRPAGLSEDVLRFRGEDVKLTLETFSEQVGREEGETDSEYAKRLTSVIADGMAHLMWKKFPEDRFYQRVPIWENYILYAMGLFSGIPEYERYHFSSPNKSIERGIGICGDASILMSQLLNQQGISNHIVSIPGHVMVNAYIEESGVLLDPDFGVALDKDIDHYMTNSKELISAYQDEGFVNNGELMIANNLSSFGYQKWDGVSHFITKKYYFEKVSYFIKWLFPIALIVFCYFLKVKCKK